MEAGHLAASSTAAGCSSSPTKPAAAGARGERDNRTATRMLGTDKAFADAASTRKTERRPQPANQGKQPVKPTRSPPQLGRTGSPPRPGGGSSGSPPIYSKQYTLRTKEELIAAGFSNAQAAGVLLGASTGQSLPGRPPTPSAQLADLQNLGLDLPQLIELGFAPTILVASGCECTSTTSFILLAPRKYFLLLSHPLLALCCRHTARAT